MADETVSATTIINAPADLAPAGPSGTAVTLSYVVPGRQPLVPERSADVALTDHRDPHAGQGYGQSA